MDNKIAILMLVAIVGYLFFCFFKIRKAAPKKEKRQKIHFEFVILGMFLGFVFGCIASPTIMKILFTENFLKTHKNPDIGMLAYYIYSTFILMIFFSIALPLVYNYLTKAINKNGV